LDDVETFEIDGARIEFFKPRGEFAIRDSSQPYPLLGKLEFRGVDFLFGETITEEEVQKELVEIYGDRIRSDILYLSRVSEQIIPNFIQTVSPQIVVVNAASGRSSGMFDTIRTYGSANSKPSVFQTELQGTVTILTDGERIRVRTYLDEGKELCINTEAISKREWRD
jgi:Predicted hydrolase (metallo-beta-lactamase superfamily)